LVSLAKKEKNRPLQYLIALGERELARTLNLRFAGQIPPHALRRSQRAKEHLVALGDDSVLRGVFGLPAAILRTAL
jgi:2-hydroxychromene-2-carboxylate isomerase